jgi:hypothetical protein
LADHSSRINGFAADRNFPDPRIGTTIVAAALSK